MYASGFYAECNMVLELKMYFFLGISGPSGSQIETKITLDFQINRGGR